MRSRSDSSTSSLFSTTISGLWSKASLKRPQFFANDAVAIDKFFDGFFEAFVAFEIRLSGVFEKLRAIQKVDENARALDVLEKTVSESEPAMRAFDQPGNVGDDKAAVIGEIDDTQIRSQRGESVIGDFGPSGADAGDESGFSGIRESDDRGIGQKLELELDFEGSCLPRRFARISALEKST